MVDALDAKIGLALAVIALTGAVWAGVRHWRKKAKAWTRETVAVRDAILGRDAIVDSITGKQIAPPLQGIGQRMATVEEALIALAKTHQRLDTVEVTQAVHAEQIAANASDIAELRAQAVERIVTKQESVQAWRAMEAAHKADPDDA